MNYLNEAMLEAKKGILNNDGGPFGAVIVDQNNNIISRAHNCVLKNNDPTAHAEIMAIRRACEKLSTNSLEGCTLYATCEPCPMCLAASIWANIKVVYYGANRVDAANIGFRDQEIYDFIADKNEILKEIDTNDQACKDMMNKYQGKMY